MVNNSNYHLLSVYSVPNTGFLVFIFENCGMSNMKLFLKDMYIQYIMARGNSGSSNNYITVNCGLNSKLNWWG